MEEKQKCYELYLAVAPVGGKGRAHRGGRKREDDECLWPSQCPRPFESWQLPFDHDILWIVNDILEVLKPWEAV